MQPNLRALFAWCALAASACPLSAAAGDKSQNVPSATEQNQRRVRALRIAEPIKIDGRLDEPAWARAEAAADFRQEEPQEGAPATEKTEVRILYDARNLYIGIRAWDSEPRRINARELLRDADFANDDKIEILLDTYHDQRNAYRFTVTPLGTQQDALITDEATAEDSTNTAWDTAWTSEGRIDKDGWTVEIAIPLSSLRFKEGLDTWGFNVARLIRRKNEETLWTSWQRSFGLERVSQAGNLEGVGEVRRRRLFEVKPYATGGWRQGAVRIGRPGYDAGLFGNGGLEVSKLGITPSLTAELTVNPDFGQTEVDQQQVNLTRFPLFFPEKRDFFLENAGIFDFGRSHWNQLFFSRRIGLTDEGEPLPIDYGAKLTGKLGRFDVGFLQVQTRERSADGGLGIPRQQFTVGRVKAGILKRSYVGAMFVNRQGGVLSAYNRGAGVDTTLNFTDHFHLIGILMATATPGLRADTHSARVQPHYESDRWRFTAVFEDIGQNFNPELGFVERPGNRQYFGQAAYKPRPKFLPFVRQMKFETQLEYYEDRRGRLSGRQAEFTWETEFKNSADLEFRPMEDVTDVLPEPFEIRPGIVIPPGWYRFNRPWIEYASDHSKRVTWAAHQGWGDFYSGRRYETEVQVGFRPNAHLMLEVADSFNRVSLPQGKFSTNLVLGRVNVNFSRKLLTSSFVQINNAARLSSINFRLRYIFRPNSDFFAIYNQSTGRGLERASYQFQVKMTYYWAM
jgi:hypothetical protein